MVWLLLVAMLLFVIQVGVVLLVEFRNPSKTTAWLLIIFMFPVIGFFLYYMIAGEYRKRRYVRRHGRSRVRYVLPEAARHKIAVANNVKEMNNIDIAKQKRLFSLLKSFPESPITLCNQSEIFSDGTATFDAIFKALEQARHHIHLEYYIIHSDTIGTAVKEILIRKAQEGVEVRLLFDGLGCYKLPSAYIAELQQGGVKVGCFFPLRNAFLTRRLNYRNHRKIIVVDGTVGFLGGINIGDEYLGRNPKFGFWRDTHMRLEGDAVYFLQQTFINDWAFVKGEKLTDSVYYPEHKCTGDERVQIMSSGPDGEWDTILELYFAAISTAVQRIHIVTPYFIPDPSLLMAIKTAALSGVDVKVILPGISDHILVKWASFAYIEELMRAGVRFFLYQGGFIHAKIMIVDETLGTVGTANLDMRSFFDNFEINAVMFAKKTIQDLEDDFGEDLGNCKEIVPEEFAKRTNYQRMKEVLARMLSPLM
ncbi:cardiolipin synthase [Gorillibacterium massiliense]|uniref:cardiolipin synthase n=1 Tax=Gorillibacterium massiliense TaxID=1280390 RepID=UPI0005954680|nr:cardiolipin synthase [Gorillibacterium massiliense]